MPYRALEELNLGSPVFPGEFLTTEHLKGRDPQVLVRLRLAEYVKDAPPAASQSAPIKREEAVAPTIETQEVAPVVEETKSLKASLEKRGVWFQAFVNGMKVYSSRDEKQTKRWIRDYNEKIVE